MRLGDRTACGSVAAPSEALHHAQTSTFVPSSFVALALPGAPVRAVKSTLDLVPGLLKLVRVHGPPQTWPCRGLKHHLPPGAGSSPASRQVISLDFATRSTSGCCCTQCSSSSILLQRRTVPSPDWLTPSEIGRACRRGVPFSRECCEAVAIRPRRSTQGLPAPVANHDHTRVCHWGGIGRLAPGLIAAPLVHASGNVTRTAPSRSSRKRLPPSDLGDTGVSRPTPSRILGRSSLVLSETIATRLATLTLFWTTAIS